MVIIDEILLKNLEYSHLNTLLGGYLVICFFFWWFVYSKSPEIELSRENILGSITSLFIKVVCWIWFISTFWLSKTILFVSRSPTFLEDKLFILGVITTITILILGILGVLNTIKYLYKIGDFKQMLKELFLELRGFNRR